MAGETGYLAPASNSSAFADLITRLIENAPLRQRMGEAARARAVTFSWDETMARMLGYYRALVGAGPKIVP